MKTKIKSKIKKEPLSVKILNYLGETSKDFLDLSVNIIFDPKSIIGGMSLYRDSGRYIPREISNLKKSPYFSQKDEKFYLSRRGRIKIIKEIIINKKKKNKKWDNFWRAIIFDIPETNRRERNFLRRELNWIGCKELQKSVWITPFDMEKELLALFKLWKKDFKGDIRFLKIAKITGEKQLKSFFKI